MTRFSRNKAGQSGSAHLHGAGGNHHDRHTLQMCGEVRRTLDLVLTGECDDDLLRGLYVASVTPAPDAAHLMVTVAPLDPQDPTPPHRILERLQIFAGRLRAAVAQSINRRKAPDLMFNFDAANAS